MKILKTILFGIVGLVGLLLITALFVKKDYAVEREIIINKPKQEVYDYIRLLKNQNNFSKWASLDPAMKTSFKGTDGTVGFISSWESKNDNVGAGEQEITKIAEGERIDYALRFKVPFESNCDAYMITEDAGNNTTKVKWGFSGKYDYPMNIMNLLMDMEKAIGGDFELGLSNLKKIMEK